jgi:hypothetical protein
MRATRTAARALAGRTATTRPSRPLPALPPSRSTAGARAHLFV